MRENVDLRNTNMSVSEGLDALLNEQRRAKGFEKNVNIFIFFPKANIIRSPIHYKITLASC